MGRRCSLLGATLKGGSDASTWRFFDVNGDMFPNIDGAETAWTAQSNVTAALETTIKKSGASSAKLTIAAGFSTGLVATYDFTAIDISSYQAIAFWIRASATVAASVLQIKVDNTAACASALETIDIPALVTDTWKLVVLPFATPHQSGMDAVISVGLNAASDPGAVIIYLDTICAVKEPTRTISAPTNLSRDLIPELPVPFASGIFGYFTGTIPRGIVSVDE